MSQQPQEQVNFTIAERVTTSNVFWTAKVRGETIAKAKQARSGGVYDSGPLVDAVAKHFGVDEDAVQFTPDPVRPGAKARVRFLPHFGRVTLPAKPVAPPTCAHLPGDEACMLATCSGTPPVTTPLDRDHAPIPEVPAGAHETGDVTTGREIIETVAHRTGLPVEHGAVATNGWSDIRPGARHIDGLMFTADGVPVRVLSYEARPPSLARYSSWMVAVYVGDRCIAQAIEKERSTWKGEVVRAVVDAVEKLHDKRALAKPALIGSWELKNPPVGFNVDTRAHGAHGIVEVVEPSRNDGMTLYMLDAEGRTFYIDRAAAEMWTATYGGANIDGTDTWARWERRKAFFVQVLAYRHQEYGHAGPAGECDECCGEVSGGRLGGQHRFGRYAYLPCCTLCGMPRPKWATEQQHSQCPGAPRFPDPDGGGEPDGPAAFPVPAEVRDEPTQAGRVHVRADSPVTVDHGDGRQGLANPCWCGRIDLPDGDKAWHVYGLRPATVTCPVCFHLFTCPWARLKEVEDRAEQCEVCAHIYGCEDKQCNPADHPGMVPEPDPAYERAPGANAVVERVHQAVSVGNFELAEKLIDAGDDHEPRHPIEEHGDWEGLRLHVGRLRKQAEERLNARISAAHMAVDLERDEHGIVWASPRLRPPFSTAGWSSAAEPEAVEAGALWASALHDIGV